MLRLLHCRRGWRPTMLRLLPLPSMMLQGFGPCCIYMHSLLTVQPQLLLQGLYQLPVQQHIVAKAANLQIKFRVVMDRLLTRMRWRCTQEGGGEC